MSKYLITGIAGFIGSHLARALLANGHTVRGIDNLSTGTMDNLFEIQNEISLLQGDIEDLKSMEEACDGMDCVLHQAALASVPFSVKDPVSSHKTNINGTLTVLLAAKSAGVRRLVYAASSSAYGNQPDQAAHESMQPCPTSPYAVQKLTGEYYTQSFCANYGMEAVCLRYFNIFGPRQSATSSYSGVIAKFITQMMRGEVPTIYGDGSVSRDFTFVDNVVQANLLASVAPSEVADGRIYNVGTGQSHTLNDLYATLSELLRFDRRADYGAPRTGDVQHSLAVIDRAAGELGYRPDTDFRSCLEKTLDWYSVKAAAI
jgi:UDP-glucose 4-epimerase